MPMSVINPDDFIPLTLTIDFSNTTTGTEVVNGEMSMAADGASRKIKTQKVIQIQVEEFTPDGFVLEIPPKLCSEGHNLTLSLQAKHATSKVGLECSGKVKSIEHQGDSDRVLVKFLQVDQKKLKLFQEFFSNRQNEIDNFFKAIRG